MTPDPYFPAYGRIQDYEGDAVFVPTRWVTTLPEALGWVTRSRSFPLGRMTAKPDDPNGVGGCIGVHINMNPWFNQTHSAEWDYSIQYSLLFWNTLASELRLLEAD
jgi:hypothetical protein